MGVSWTAEQQQVIDLRNRNILVSAAAGSGKTAVLVERIIKMITDKEHPVDIDRLLIVTFTNAAAAEMRERIGAAIEKALEENPSDEHLQRQLTLIHNAQITTIDSFCLYVIRNHFHEIDLEPNFRIGDEGELKLLKEDVLKKLLEENYENQTEDFTNFVESYAFGRSDAALNDMILQLYEFSKSYPWPKEWLTSLTEGYAVTNEEELNQAEWMKPLLENIKAVIKDVVVMIEEALALTQAADGPYMYEKAISSDLEKYQAIAELDSFSEYCNALTNLTYDRMAGSKKYEGSVEKQERVKALRDKAKDVVKKICKQYFFCSTETMIEQLKQTKEMAAELVRLTLDFSDAFAAKKREKNLVDFHDLEHFALEILVDEETREVKKTAEEFRDSFAEIMIDEYQDSNQVQETILRSISKEARGENNIFMVGDVKQSIYRFRLARPELFMEKYDTYSIEESATQRIDLHKNFRSRKEVLECTNDIFYRIMDRDLGNVVYDAKAALYPGAVYPDKPKDSMGKTDFSEEELQAACHSSVTFAPEILLTDSNEEVLEDTEYTDKKLLEAKMVSEKVKQLMENQQVTDKKSGELRKLRYSDIVILLRSLNGWADQFVSVLNDAGIPAHTVSSTGYFSAIEVQTVLCMLRILDNPRQDIPLAAVLRSPIAGLTDEELAEIRLTDKSLSFHECVLKLWETEDAVSTAGESTKENVNSALGNEEEHSTGNADIMRDASGMRRKLHEFYKMYSQLRQLVADTPIHELIEIILKVTGYGNYAAAMPAGERRKANLEMLVEKAIAYENTSYKGLFHFVRYIDELQKYDVDFGEADLIGENEDVVRIMSIHKSKGLEFPVVFVSGMGKNFNKQDVRSKMVLHPELGIGLDFMDGNRRIKSPTIIKKAIAKQIDLENLGEELRVLYVALTRAKEKLILTGNKKDALEALEELRIEVEGYAQEEIETQKKEKKKDSDIAEDVFAVKRTPLSYLTREEAMTYLDWVLPALLSYGEKYQITVVNTGELVVQEIKTQMDSATGKQERLSQIEQAEEALLKELEERFRQQYPYETDVARKNKYSVSELKHRAMRENFEREQEELIPAFAEEPMVPCRPKFIREIEGEEFEEVSRGALRGTAVHRVMECYQFTSEDTAREQIDRMLKAGMMTEEQAKLVRLPIIEGFVQSETGKRMKNAEQAGLLYKEKPFVMGFTGEELEQFGFGDGSEGLRKADAAVNLTEQKKISEDLTLIQGIIDVFWIEEDKITVLDYKTDRVATSEELVLRYKAQMDLYAEALNRVFAGQGLKVKEKLLYSFCLEQIIPV